MGKWKRFKRRLRRLVHPNVWDMRAAMRLGRMQGKKEASIQLPPIFGGHPVYIPMPAAMPELMGMFASPRLAVIPDPRGRYFKQWCHAYSETVELPRIKRTVLERYVGPPLEDDTAHEVPAWIV